MKSKANATDDFRMEHLDLKRHLNHLRGALEELAAQEPAEQRDAMAGFVGFFEKHVLPHAAWEEAQLYPLADRLVGGTQPFTAAMRYEHHLVGRWLDALRRERDKLDAAAFARRGGELLGLVGAHFETEEEVLLPLLDQSMTPEELDAALAEHAAP
jgi:hemerythrin-like domain-containing protein